MRTLCGARTPLSSFPLSLLLQAVMSFHAAGGNVGDTCKIPLPRWVLDIGLQDPDIFFTDRQGVRNRECLSLGCDDISLDEFDRTPVDMYGELVGRFVDEFQVSLSALASRPAARRLLLLSLPARLRTRVLAPYAGHD